MLNEVDIIAITFASAFISSVSQYFFKRGLPKINLDLASMKLLLKSRVMILGAVLYLVSLVFYLEALRMGQLSFVYPTFASVFVFVLLFSKFLLHEEISWKRAGGVLLIMLGIVLIAFSY